MSIEQRIAENTAALIENTALLRQLLDASGGSATKPEPEAKPAKKVKLPKTAEPAKEETPEAKTTEVTHDMIAKHVRNVFAEAKDLANKKAEWKEILAKFEVKQISQLEGDDLAKLWHQAQTL